MPAILRACGLQELKDKAQLVVHGADRPVVVFYNSGTPVAVDNRCPHMGFPLNRGTCKSGIITCHWHHARFDAASGCTFDLFAGDVEPYDVEVRGQDVYVSPHPRPRDPVEHGRRMLREGMERDANLNTAKAILMLRDARLDTASIVREAALFGVTNRDDFAAGLVILTAMANLVPHLDGDTAYLALYQGITRTAGSCVGQTPHRRRYPLDADEYSLDSLDRLLRYWTMAHHRDGAERTLLTALRVGATQQQVVRLLFTAATERFYMDTGHLVDFCNKAIELLDLIGWEHAALVLPALAGPLTSARGQEEFDSWRQPIDLVPLVRGATDRLADAISAGHGKSWNNEARLAEQILGEDPASILESILGALQAGATPSQLGRSLAYAAAVRLARFPMSNEIGDWITALHSFTYCNAMHRALKRCDDPLLLRGVLHGAMTVFQNRFLNVPAAKLPGERGSLDDLPRDAAAILAQFLAALDSQNQVDTAARLVARYLQLGHDPRDLFDAMTQAVVREDANFHTFQMLEAGIRQYHEWGNTPQGTVILVAVARYLAAHSPTQRADYQTAKIALRLHRGEAVFEEEP